MIIPVSIAFAAPRLGKQFPLSIEVTHRGLDGASVSAELPFEILQCIIANGKAYEHGAVRNALRT